MELTPKKYEHLKRIADDGNFLLIGSLVGYDFQNAKGEKVKLVFTDGKCSLNEKTQAQTIADVKEHIEKKKEEGQVVPFAVLDELAAITVAQTVNVKFSDGNVYELTPGAIEEAINDAKAANEYKEKYEDLLKQVEELKKPKEKKEKEPKEKAAKK